MATSSCEIFPEASTKTRCQCLYNPLISTENRACTDKGDGREGQRGAERNPYRPEGHENGEVGCEEGIEPPFDALVHGHEYSRYCEGNQPRCVVTQQGEVESNLFAQVILYTCTYIPWQIRTTIMSTGDNATSFGAASISSRELKAKSRDPDRFFHCP